MVSIDDAQLRQKIKSYIYQDCETLMMNPECKEKQTSCIPKNYIELTDIRVLLELQENKCYICKETFKNYTPGCKNQITLDRLNARQPHLKGNILLACWYCNCYGYNKQKVCKDKCCTKSKELRKKNDVPKSEITDLLCKYNTAVQGKYTPNDDWKDYTGDGVELSTTEEGYTMRSFRSEKASRDYFKIKFELEVYQHNSGTCDDDCCICLEQELNSNLI